MRDIREKNWFWIENDLIDRTDLDMSEKFMYMILARFSDSSGICFPSYEKLSEITGKDKRTLMRYIKKIEEKGLIEKKKRFNKSNIYYLKNVKFNSDKNDSDKNDSDKNVTSNSDTSVTSNSDKNVTLTIPIEKNTIKKTQYIPPLYFPQPKNEIENYINELEKENEYKDLLVEFVKYRKKIGHSFKTKIGLKTLVKEFEKLEELREAINIAMENEWRGVKKAWVLNYKKSLQAKEVETKGNKFKGVTPESIKKLIGGLT